MKYILKLNGTFNLEDTRHFEAYLQNFLFQNNLGFVEREMTKVCYEDKEADSENRADKIPIHSLIEIDLPDREEVLDELLEILDEIGIPFGSKIYNDGVSIDVGTLSQIQVNYTLDTKKSIKKKVDKLEDKLEWDYLDELCVVSHNYIFENNVKYFLYVADADMSILIIDSFFKNEKYIKSFDIKAFYSGYGIAHRYFSLLRKNYKEKNIKLWNSVKDIYQGASDEDIRGLKKVYPDAPSSLIELLKIIDGTWNTRHEKGIVDLPMFTTIEAGKPINLLSTKQMIANIDLSKKTIQNRIRNMDVDFDKFISNDLDNINVLFLASSELNYGFCELLIDFHPNDKGNKGQLIVYSEKFNSYCTTEKSFDEFLLDILNNDFYDMFKVINDNGAFSVKDEGNEYENLEYSTEDVFWAFDKTEYTDMKAFNKELKEYMEDIMEESVTISELKEIVLNETEMILSYEAWIENLNQLKENEILEPQTEEELLEKNKEDGMWQVNILALIKSDSKKGFLLGELMMKVHNQMANKELGDHVYFEGFEYLGHEAKIEGLTDNKNSLPVFEVILGS